MNEYHKIQTIFKRDEKGRIIIGEYSLPELEYLKDLPWVFTEKVDGTNIRVTWDGTQVIFGGKTDKAQIPTFLQSSLENLFCDIPMKKKFKEVFEETPACLYGEGYGARIQKGGGNYISDGTSFVLFDIKIGNYWLLREDIERIAEQLGLKVVPIIGEGTLDDALKIVTGGLTSKWGPFDAEGIVARPKVELRTRRGDRIITKIKQRDYA